MNLNALQKSLDRLLETLGDRAAEDWGLAPMQTAGLDATHEDFDDPEAAWHALTQAAPTAGWLQWQSHQVHFEERLPEPKPGWGALLAAEAIVTDTESLRLDYLDGRWRLTRYRHDPDGDAYLCDETHHLLHGARDRYLHYRRYWTIDAEQGAVPVCALLIDISGDRED